MASDLAKQVRIVIVDDHTLFRHGVIEILSAEADFQVVADGGSGPDAVRLAAEHEPDVLLLDVEMPGAGATATIQRIRDVAPATRTVVLSMHASTDLVRELTSAGASAYIVKASGREELCAGIRSMASGSGTVLWCVPQSAMPTSPDLKESTLTSREIEILKLVADALSNAEIASRLFVSEATVKRHLTRAYVKLRARSRLEAVSRAVSLGVLSASAGRTQ